MMHPQLRTPNSPSVSNVAGNIFKSAAAVTCCSGIAELIAQLIGPKCLMTCLVSMALGWASQLVAIATPPAGNGSVPTETSLAVVDSNQLIYSPTSAMAHSMLFLANPALMKTGAESKYHR